MDQRELDYIDVRDPQARYDYINNAPEPQPGEPLPEQHQEVIALPLPPRPTRGRPRKSQAEQIAMKKYVKTAATQKVLLGSLFTQHGDTKIPEWYSSQCGITISNIKVLLCKIRKGESILPKGHYKRKSRVIPFQHLVLTRLEIDQTTSLRTIRRDLSKVIERHGDDIANIPADVMNAIVAEDERRPEDAPVGDVADQSETAGKGSDSVEVVQAQESSLTVPSVTALSKFLRGLTKTNEGRKIPVISFKKCSVRGPAAKTEENKTLRIEAIKQLRNKIGAGYWSVCIDETNWRVGNTTAYGHAKRGEKCFVSKSRGGISLTSVSAIDTRGVSYCNLTTTTNTMETFNAYFLRLIAKYDEANRPCVFWADNCRIHNEMRDIVAGTRHCVVFNAAYSPELNPIENIFGLWKRYSERDVREWTNLQNLFDKIAAAFMRIEPHHVTASMERCRTDVWLKVLERQNL